MTSGGIRLGLKTGPALLLDPRLLSGEMFSIEPIHIPGWMLLTPGGVAINIWRAEQLCKKVKGQFFVMKTLSDSDGFTSLYFLPAVCNQPEMHSDTINYVVAPFVPKKMIRAPFYLRNREGSCQTAHCCLDFSTLCPYFVSFS